MALDPLLVMCSYSVLMIRSFSSQQAFNDSGRFIIIFIHLALTQFDWEGDLPLKHPQRDLVIYEMHVRGFTRHESSNAKFPGTYRGLVEKLEHLKVRLHYSAELKFK